MKNEFVSELKKEIELSITKDMCLSEKDKYLRSIFDRFRTMGVKVVRDNEKRFSHEETFKLLQSYQIPCLGNGWNFQNSKLEINRKNCCYQNIKSLVCEINREAIDGFLTGLEGVGGTLRYSRHHSLGFDEDYCLDYIYDSKTEKLKWAKIPEKYHKFLNKIKSKLEKISVEVFFEGYTEGKIYYHIHDDDQEINFFRYQFIVDSIKKISAKYSSNIKLIETSARFVFN